MDIPPRRAHPTRPSPPQSPPDEARAQAKVLLGWRPHDDLRRMAGEAWSYERAPDDPRVI